MILFKSLTFLAHNLMFALAGIIGIGFVIGFHELGHFFFCKLFKIRTPTFSIGFGPRIFKKKIGDTEFALSAIPLGGYVEIAGSAELGQGEQKDAQARDAHSFAIKPYYQKALVMLGGIFFNLLFAYFALILLCMIGLPKSTPTIKTVEPDSAAQKYNLQPGDTIIAINNEQIDNNLEKALRIIAPKAGEEITLSVKRNNEFLNIPLVLGSKPGTIVTEDGTKKSEVGALGVTFEMTRTASLSLSQAIPKGIEQGNYYIKATINGFKAIFQKKGASNLQGPLGIISLIVEGFKQSLSIFFLLLALISINIAILQLIPLPILDGGQLLYYTIEAIIRRPISPKIREYIHIASWLLVLALILYLSAKDIYRMAKPLFSKFIK